MPVLERFSAFSIKVDRVKFDGILDRCDLSFHNMGFSVLPSVLFRTLTELNIGRMVPEDLEWQSLRVTIPEYTGGVSNHRNVFPWTFQNEVNANGL